LRELTQNGHIYWLDHFMPTDAINYCETACMWLRRYEYCAKFHSFIHGVPVLVSAWNSIYCWDAGRQMYGI
jgi:hypothetical protein